MLKVGSFSLSLFAVLVFAVAGKEAKSFAQDAAPAPSMTPAPVSAPVQDAAPAPIFSGPSWELTGGTSGSYEHLFGNAGHSDTNEVHVNIGIDYFICQALEVGFRGSFVNNLSSASSSYTIIPTAGPIFNFLGKTPQRSFFFEGRIGAYITELTNGHDYTTLSYAVGLGHRFELITPSLTWSPEVLFGGHTSATTAAGYTLASQQDLDIIPIQLSILF